MCPFCYFLRYINFTGKVDDLFETLLTTHRTFCSVGPAKQQGRHCNCGPLICNSFDTENSHNFDKFSVMLVQIQFSWVNGETLVSFFAKSFISLIFLQNWTVAFLCLRSDIQDELEAKEAKELADSLTLSNNFWCYIRSKYPMLSGWRWKFQPSNQGACWFYQENLVWKCQRTPNDLPVNFKMLFLLGYMKKTRLHPSCFPSIWIMVKLGKECPLPLAMFCGFF